MSQEAAQAQHAAVQLQLTSAETQIRTLSEALDTVRREASEAFRDLRDNQSRLSQGTSGHTTKDWKLVSVKEFMGGKFAGAKTESWKQWAKKVKIYCNSQKDGFRRALESIELNPDAAVDQRVLSDLNWEHTNTANSKLADFLHMYCAEDALRIVEGCPDQGFEAWRLLVKRHAPSGGRYELDRMNSMLARKQCKDLSDLPAAIDVLERDLRTYEATMGAAFPPEWKIPLLLQLMPESHKRELQMKYTMGERDFRRMCDNVSQFATEHRLYEHRGRKDMEVDHVFDTPKSSNKYSDAEWEEYVASCWLSCEELDYMGPGKGGKGGKNGKSGKSGKSGKGGKDGNGKGGKDGKGPGSGKETRECHWCLKPGHLIAECRAKLAGKPKTKRSAGANSCDEEWEEDDPCGSVDLPCDACDCEDDPDVAAASSDEWTDEDAERSLSLESPVGGRVAEPPSSPARQPVNRPTFLSQFQDSPASASSTSTVSVTFYSDLISKQQEDLRKKISEMLAPPPPPGMQTPLVLRVKKNRNQSHKQKMIRILNACANTDCTRPHEDRTLPPKATAIEASTQTNIQLPHKFLDVIWTANNLEPVIDGTESSIAVGVGMEDVDFLEDEFMNEAVNPANFNADKTHNVIESTVEQPAQAPNIDVENAKIAGESREN